MNKIQLCLLSLIGALPAGFLTYLLGMYLISQPTGASSLVMIISIITLICTTGLTATPVLILTMYHSNYDPPKARKADKSKVADDLDDDEKSGSKAGADDEEAPVEEGDDMLASGDDEDIMASDDGEDLMASDDGEDMQTLDDEE